MRRRQVGRAALAAALVLAVAGCGGQEEGPEVPEDAVRLVVNQPTSVDGLVLTAYHVREGSAKVMVRDGEEFESAVVDVGSHAEALGFEFRLVAVELDADRGDAPGGDRSTAWIVAEPTG